MKELTDDALLAIIKRRPHEFVLSRVGCMTASAFAFAPALGAANAFAPEGAPEFVRAIAWTTIVALGTLCAFPITGLLMSPLIALRDLRARAEIRELRRRWGQSPMVAYATRAQAMQAGGGTDAGGRPPPDIVVVFQARGLPDGRRRFLRVDLWDRPTPKAEAEQRRAPAVLDAADSDLVAAMTHEEGDLPSDLTLALRDRIRALGDAPPTRGGSRKGMFCWATILTRDPATKRELKADLTSATPTDETTAVLSLLLGASEALLQANPNAG